MNQKHTDTNHPQNSASAIKIGRIPFLVCAPFFHSYLENNDPGLQFLDGPPVKLNQYLKNNLVHTAPSSSLEYALSPELYVLSPHWCTSSTMEVRSVLLFSSVPLEDKTIGRVFLTSQSATSAALVQILFRLHLHIQCSYEVKTLTDMVKSSADAKAMTSQDRSAILLIGDEALLMHQKQSATYPYVYDLATLWQKYTGLPFVFGAWIFRKSTVLEHPDLCRHWHQAIGQSISSFREAPGQALEKWFAHYPTDLPLEVVEDYFDVIDYSLGTAHKESLQRFYQEAAQCGILSKAPDKLEFL